MREADIYDRAEAAAGFIRERIEAAALQLPRLGMVLGSGLGGFASRVDNALSIPYADIPHFPQSTVEGHSGRMVIGTIRSTEGAAASIPVAVLQGRVHAYEGYSPTEVTFPMRVLGRLGIATVVVTNAAGGIRSNLHQGQLALISDHINFTGSNPCTGPNDPRFGRTSAEGTASGLRFFDMSEAYSQRLRILAMEEAARQGSRLAEGVYLCVPGPSFETPAEIRAFRALGADLVGMSTVHEVIVARHMGIEVLGLSLVTNMAAGVLTRQINHAEVLEAGRHAEAQLTALLTALAPRM